MSRTYIGPSLSIEGDLEGADELVIAGSVKGNTVTGRDVSIEKGGQVHASVQAESLRVSGHLEGSVDARGRVELSGEGHLEGDVKAPRIAIADGARFKGHIETGA